MSWYLRPAPFHRSVSDCRSVQSDLGFRMRRAHPGETSTAIGGRAKFPPESAMPLWQEPGQDMFDAVEEALEV